MSQDILKAQICESLNEVYLPNSQFLSSEIKALLDITLLLSTLQVNANT